MAEKENVDVRPSNSNTKVEEADFTAVVFHGVSDIYAPDKDIECNFTIKSSVKPTNKDWVGLFKVGWQSSGEHYTYEWSPFIESVDEERRPIANRVTFRAKYLPKSDEEFYQFCYVTNTGEVRGASVPFQIKAKTDASDYEFCEVEDDDSMLMIKNRTSILEESLSRALEENSCLKVSNEKRKSDAEKLNDVIVGLEKRKSELTGQLNHERKQNSSLAKELEVVNKELKVKIDEFGRERIRKAELEVEVGKLVNDKKEMVVIVEHANKKCEEFAEIVEKEQVQFSEAQKSKEKLVGEKLQYLQKIAENRELTDNLTAELSKKTQEIATLKDDKESLNVVIVSLKQDISHKDAVIAKMQDEKEKERERTAVEKAQAVEGVAKRREELQTLFKKFECKQREVDDVNDVVQTLMAKIKSLEKEKDVLMDTAMTESRQFETRVQIIMEEALIKDDTIQRLECELEDAKENYETENGRNTALEEDYESAIRGLEHQLEGERALNKSLCTQTDNAVTDLQSQLEHQLQVNAEQSRVLEAKAAEAKAAIEELEAQKNHSKSLQERLNVAVAQLSATDTEVNALKTEKEVLQTSLCDTKGNNEKSSKNSAASMYALQTAHAHLEKKYVEIKKKMEELWKDKNELKRALAVMQGSLSATDLRHEIEEFRAKNEDLRVRLNMGAEAYKVKFIECRRLESQLRKLQRLQPCVEGGSSTITKLHQELEDQKSAGLALNAALEAEKETVKQKNQHIEEVKLELRQLSQDMESLSVKKVEEEKSQMAGYTQQLEDNLSERQNRLTEMEEMFQNEKAEKHNLIEEIMNLQEQMKTYEQENNIKDEEVGKVREMLTQEQDEKDRLGEMAREKIQELEETVKHLKEEVERWKKEVDIHVEAEARIMGSRQDTTEQQQQTSPDAGT
ncbi:hypothetical protein QZH41_014158 [Actinostola sp. cb2023]|nr:hypothetical protein QZH41_014158 [Actinostola sp. cb2023]